MKKIVANLNYLAIILTAVGGALLLSYGRKNLWGWLGLLLGFASFAAYLIMNRDRFKSRNSLLNFIFASNLAIIVALILAITVAVNYLATKVHARVDMSEGRIHSISQQSIQVVKNLKKDLQVTGLFPGGSQAQAAFEHLIKLYRYYSKRIKFTTIDPFKNPSQIEEMVRKYSLKSPQTVIFEYGEKNTRVEEFSEEAITNAIVKITREKEKTIYFTKGHGEQPLEKKDLADPAAEQANQMSYSEVKDSLEKISYKIKEVLLQQEPDIPADCAVLVVAGPKSSLTEREIQLIDNYVWNRQGRLFLLLDPDHGEELAPLLRKLGVQLDKTVVVEAQDYREFLQKRYDNFMIHAYPSDQVSETPAHEMVKSFVPPAILPMTRSLSKLPMPPANVEVSPVLMTGTSSWAATNIKEMNEQKKIIRNPADRAGPLDLVYAVQVAGDGKKSRVVVAGTSLFAIKAYYFLESKANGNFFNNAVNWLAEEGDLIAIPPPSPGSHPVNLSPQNTNILFFYTIVLLPLLVFLIGVGIWFYRRKL